MSYNEPFADRVRVALADRGDVAEKKMFSGLCFMVKGHMCCGLTATDFMVRGLVDHEAGSRQPRANPLGRATRYCDERVSRCRRSRRSPPRRPS
ncbi:MAG: TfoX/Sxy family protein [Myxococcales bacterium]|nr:TfoX/Sxy family protein [Myxococcales bacterium]